MNWNKKKLKKIVNFLPIFGLILFVYIIVNIGIEQIANTFIKIPFYFYILSFIPTFPRILLYALKWQHINKKQKIYINFFEVIKITLISTFYGVVTPGGYGLHIKVFHLSKKTKAPLAKCITNSLIDASTSYIVGVALSLIGAIILIDKFPGFAPIFVLYLIVLVFLFVVFMRKNDGSKIFKFVIKSLIPKKYKEKLDKSVNLLYEDIPKYKDLIIPMIYELVIWIILGIQTYILAQAFSINISFSIFILIHTISVVIISLIPISVGGLGVREGTFVVLLGLYGVEKEIAFVISLSGFIVKMVIPGIIGMFLSFKKEYKIIKEK
jgi:glycosyltransferase 2 family protein